MESTSKIGITLLVGVGIATTLGFTKMNADSTAERVKVVAGAALIYAADFNELLPLQCAKKDGRWASGRYMRKSAQTGPDASIWMNSLQPYLVEGAAALKIEGSTFTVEGGEFSSGMSYNGLLHASGTAQIAKPELVPLVWTPFGKQNTSAALTTPTIMCSTSRPCYYFDLAQDLGGNASMPSNLKVSSESALYSINLNLTLARPTAFGRDWKEAIYTPKAEGQPAGTWQCFRKPRPNGTSDSHPFPCFFRPDREE